MEKEIIIKFILNLDSHEETYPLLGLVLKNLEKLEKSGVQLEYFELRLEKVGITDNTTRAYIKMDSHERTITGSGTSFRPDEAFLSVFEKERDKLLECEKYKIKLPYQPKMIAAASM
jgi:hypothetical protein